MTHFAPLSAQNKRLHFHHLNTTNGLSQSSCSFVYRDSYGFIWISSTDGLMQFDGQSIQVFRPQGGVSRSMEGKNIQSPFFEDIHHDIWFSSYHAVNVYRRETNDFEHFHINSPGVQTASSGYCILLSDDANGLWVSVDSKLFWMNPLEKNPEKSTRYAGEVLGKRACAAPSANGIIQTFYTYDRFTNGANGFWEYAVENGRVNLIKHHFSGGNNLPSLKIFSIVAEMNGLLWLATDKGLIKYDKNTEAWLIFNKITPKQIITSSEGLATDGSDKLWVSTNLGLALFDRSKSQFTALFPPDIYGGNDGPAKATSELYLDPAQVLWCTVNGAGVDFTALNKPKFDYFPINNSHNTAFNPGSMAQDITGDIWFASNYDSIRIYSAHRENNWSDLTEKVWKIANIPGKNLLIAPMTKPPYVWNPIQQKKLPIIDSEGKAIPPLFHVFVSPAREIFGLPYAEKGGICRIEPVGNQYISHRINNPLLNKWFNLAHEDSLGTLYLGEEFTNLIAYKRSGDSVQFLKRFAAKGEAKAIYEDNRHVWVGGEFGLCRIEKKTLQDTLLKEMNGQMVYGILADNNANLWLSTNRGIIRLQKDSLQFRQYSLADGLQDFEYNTKSFMKTTDGRLWFGGIKGINVFNPAQIQDLTTPPIVQITNIVVNGQPFNAGRNVTLIDSLELTYQQNSISLDFVALEYSDPSNNKLQYRMFEIGGRPYDDTWVTCKTAKGFARYSNLPPGQYIFKIRGFNSDGVMNPTSRCLYLKINPPYYQTTWFKVLATILALIAIYLGTTYYYRHKLRLKNMLLSEQQLQIEKQQALTMERNRIAAEMHDDFGSGLTAIQRISERAAAKTESLEAKKAIENITAYSLELIANMREIIWAMGGKNDTLENLIAYISDNAYRYLSNHNIEAEIIQPEEIPDIEMTGEKRRNIYLAVKESLHNAVKHANPTVVTTTFEISDQLLIHVHDNGRGFNEALKTDGNGMTNMAKRMEDIGGNLKISNDNGLRLTFSVPINNLKT